MEFGSLRAYTSTTLTISTEAYTAVNMIWINSRILLEDL
jgi:hypothetical protein